jgi:hypothetical protein
MSMGLARVRMRWSVGTTERVIFLGVRLIAAGLLFGALARHPYDYYIVLRWVTSAVALLCIYMAWRERRIVWMWLFGLIALVFNPAIPLHPSRRTWIPIDVAAATVVLLSAVVLHGGDGPRLTRPSSRA